MKVVIFTMLMALLAISYSAPTSEELPPNKLLEDGPTKLAPLRAIRGNEKTDLEGSESAYLAYPYAWPYWNHWSPYVIVG